MEERIAMFACRQRNGDQLELAVSREPQRTAQENKSKIPTLSKKVAATQ